MKELPLLCAPSTGEALYLYLSVSDQAIASVLIKEGDKQQPVYFVSKVLDEAEMRYSHIEKVAFALVIVA